MWTSIIKDVIKNIYPNFPWYNNKIRWNEIYNNNNNNNNDSNNNNNYNVNNNNKIVNKLLQQWHKLMTNVNTNTNWRE